MTTNVPAVTTEQLLAMVKSGDVSYDDVITVFVSKFEQSVLAKMQRLKDSIFAVKAAQTKLEKDVKEKYFVPFEQEMVVPFGKVLVSTNKRDGEIRWGADANPMNYGTPTSMFRTKYELQARSATNNTWRDTHWIDEPIDQSYVNQYKSIKEQLKALEEELEQALIESRSIGQKERQIRAKLAERKLSALGIGDVLADADLLRLIEM